MKAPKLILTALSALVLIPAAHAGEEVNRLLKEYSKIETVSCRIRRTVDGEETKIKFLSRIYYTNKDQLHVENLTPVKRRTIADGERLYQYGEGDPKGFSRPIGDLSDAMILSLRKVPGTAMDHLLRLKGMKETPLPKSNPAAKRIGIDTGKQYVVLLFDDHGRLAEVEFYKSAEMKEKTADYTYSDFQEVLPDVWVPFHHSASLTANGNSFSETVRIDRFVVNNPVAESLFIASSFFDKDIDFVDDFAKIYPE